MRESFRRSAKHAASFEIEAGIARLGNASYGRASRRSAHGCRNRDPRCRTTHSRIRHSKYANACFPHIRDAHHAASCFQGTFRVRAWVHAWVHGARHGESHHVEAHRNHVESARTTDLLSPPPSVLRAVHI
jgi:hypothetical protein